MKRWKFCQFVLICLALEFAVPQSLWAHGTLSDQTAAIPLHISVKFAPTPVLAEGQWHIIYELNISNTGKRNLQLQKLEILDESTDKVMQTISGDTLIAALARPGTHNTPDPASIEAGMQTIVFIDLQGDQETPPPQVLYHRLGFTPIDGSIKEQNIVSSGTLRINPTPPVVLAAPLRGGNWLASHGLSNTSSHRRSLLTINGPTTIAQRYAIDWTQIGDDGQIFRGDPAKNSNWTPYNADVLAVANGRIVEVLDGLPENDPTSDTKAIAINYDNAPGNHIVMDIGQGHFVLYAHLKPASLLVHVGDLVSQGQILASLGNSGKADAPHLHFQVMDGPSPLGSEGLPFVFATFTLQGHVSSLGIFVDGTGWHATKPPVRRHDEIPIENAVVDFSN